MTVEIGIIVGAGGLIVHMCLFGLAISLGFPSLLRKSETCARVSRLCFVL